jgi:hypothetical protein
VINESLLLGDDEKSYELDEMNVSEDVKELDAIQEHSDFHFDDGSH